MSGLITQSDFLLLLRLIAAHLIADFLFQMDSWVEQRQEKKWASGWLYVHAALAAVLAYIFAGFWKTIWLPAIIFGSHVLLDLAKCELKDTARSFLLDQLGHLIVILVSWVILANINIPNIAKFLVLVISNVKIWIFALSYFLVIWPAGIWVAKFTEPWRKEIGEASSQGLEKAGLWIGRLERILILTFFLLARFEAIGFLIAAKSIFRFGEIRTPNRRREAEYILIGTTISFIIAIGLGIFTNLILKYSLELGK